MEANEIVTQKPENGMKKRESIVIADDNKNLCQTLRDILEEKGYVVDTVYNGYELLGYLEGKRPDVIILDIMMPVKGGLDILNSIKSISDNTKIIIYTAFEKYKTSVYARVVDRFLIKTDPPNKVLEAIEELL